MLPGVTRNRRAIVLWAVLLAVTVVAVPVLDLVIFGIHDHLSRTRSRAANAADDTGAGHHCETSVSPAGLTCEVNIPLPAVAISQLSTAPQTLVSHTRPPAQAPPRA